MKTHRKDFSSQRNTTTTTTTPVGPIACRPTQLRTPGAVRSARARRRDREIKESAPPRHVLPGAKDKPRPGPTGYRTAPTRLPHIPAPRAQPPPPPPHRTGMPGPHPTMRFSTTAASPPPGPTSTRGGCWMRRGRASGPSTRRRDAGHEFPAGGSDGAGTEGRTGTDGRDRAAGRSGWRNGGRGCHRKSARRATSRVLFSNRFPVTAGLRFRFTGPV